ncbi:MAG: hypothetical protein OQK12_10795 [Motiliproteus sp.]|nr:hypothetical protein [Motiliproteus sp.]MCW9054264.1 hypothetical protein [Motiliproteus sp.]
MLTYQDCLDMCDLTQEEIDAIAEYEHSDSIHALATGGFLVQKKGGERMIRRMIIDDIRQAQAEGNKSHESELKQVLVHFIKTHPNHEVNKSL